MTLGDWTLIFIALVLAAVLVINVDSRHHDRRSARRQTERRRA